MDVSRFRNFLLGAVAVFLILSLVLTLVQPTKPVTALPAGVNTPIVGLEMALNPAQVWNVLGDPQTSEGQKMRAAFDLGTRIDFAYIVSYSLAYLFLTLLLVRRQTASHGWLYLAISFIAVTAFTDVLENRAIFNILGAGTLSLVDSHMDELIVFTRVKWLFLGLSGIPASILMRREGRRGPSFLLTAAFAFGALGIFKQYAVEMMTLFLAFFWAYLFIKLLPLKNRWWV